jgi:hypothetical protein
MADSISYVFWLGYCYNEALVWDEEHDELRVCSMDLLLSDATWVSIRWKMSGFSGLAALVAPVSLGGTSSNRQHRSECSSLAPTF